MEFGDILALASIFFLLCTIFSAFKKFKLVGKVEAIFICLLFMLLYGFLCVGYVLGWSLFSAILGIASIIFLLMTIYFMFRHPIIMEKWQAIIVSLIGFIFYGFLFVSIYEAKSTSTYNQSSGIVNKAINNIVDTDKNISETK